MQENQRCWGTTGEASRMEEVEEEEEEEER